MAVVTTDPLLDHLEQTFAESYRKEIDQEEDVWRSLPFLAATLALQLAGLAQVRDWVAAVDGPMLMAAEVSLCVAGVLAFAALVFLALSVWPADFRRVAAEPAFRAYAESVRADAIATATSDTEMYAVTLSALMTIKAALIEQNALAVDNNRTMSTRRAKWRTRAGLATLKSVFAVLALVALVVLTNVHGHAGHSSTRSACRTTASDVGPEADEPRPATTHDRHP